MSQSLFQLSLPPGAKPDGALHAVFVRDDGLSQDLRNRVLAEDGADLAAEMGLAQDDVDHQGLWSIQMLPSVNRSKHQEQDHEQDERVADLQTDGALFLWSCCFALQALSLLVCHRLARLGCTDVRAVVSPPSVSARFRPLAKCSSAISGSSACLSPLLS